MLLWRTQANPGLGGIEVSSQTKKVIFAELARADMAFNFAIINTQTIAKRCFLEELILQDPAINHQCAQRNTHDIG
jgi:hypothetical protein